MKFDDLKKRPLTIGTIIAILSLCGGVLAYANTIGFKVDRPAWQSEITVLAQAIQSLQKSTDQRELFRLRQLEDDLLLRIATAESKGKAPNPLDVLKLQQVRRQIGDLKGQN